MNWFDKQHERREPPGLEAKILKKLPAATLLAVLIPLAISLLARMMPAQPGIDAARRIRTIDILVIASEITLLTAAMTVAIGAIIVHIMKGPAYVADTYPVVHADQPRRERDA